MKKWIIRLFSATLLLAGSVNLSPKQASISILGQQSSIDATSGTVPFVLDGNRIYAELVFIRPDGTLRKALAFVDLGSPSPIVSKELFDELGIDHKRPLVLRFGQMTIRADSNTVSSDPWLPFAVGQGRQVEALLPAGIMQNYQIVMDYANRTLTFAQPGTLRGRGIAVPIHVNEQTGLIAVDVTINGKSYPVTVDDGSAYTWLRKNTVQEWLNVHPDWQRGIGAVGPSNMRMADDGIEAAGILVRIPEIQLGALRLRQIGALAIGPDNTNVDFLDWYAKKSPAQVIGWLGGNALRGFRITIDYPNRMSYWLKQSEPDPHDLDQVGLTLVNKGGSYFVAAIVTQDGKPTVGGVNVGDKIVSVDGLQIGSAPWGAIFGAMHGKPGEARTLVLERQGTTLTMQTKITEF